MSVLSLWSGSSRTKRHWVRSCRTLSLIQKSVTDSWSALSHDKMAKPPPCCVFWSPWSPPCSLLQSDPHRDPRAVWLFVFLCAVMCLCCWINKTPETLWICQCWDEICKNTQNVILGSLPKYLLLAPWFVFFYIKKTKDKIFFKFFFTDLQN